MNLTIEMPFEAYRGFVNKFDASSVEFRLLASGYVERRRRKGLSGVVVQITCETEQAQLLLNKAVDTCPEAARANRGRSFSYYTRPLGFALRKGFS